MNIAIITASQIPIPATRGGATETMMTHLLDVNENHNNIFHVFSYYDEEAELESQKYKKSIFHYYHPQGGMEKSYGLFFRFLRKATLGHTYIRSYFVKWCAEIINKSDIDLVILEGNNFQTLQMRSLISKPMVLHMHIDRLNVTLDNGKNIINACSGVWAISEYCRKRMIEVDPSAENKIHVLKNTVDVDKFVPGDKQALRKVLHDKYNIPYDVKIVSYCGRITEDKGVLELVKAIDSLKDDKIFLLIIGSSVYRDGKKTEYVKKIEQTARSVSGGSGFTGYIPQQELPRYVSATDLAVVPSLCQEAAGNVTIEALACGVPVVASTQGGIPEYADVAACDLIDVGNDFIPNLADAIKRMLKDKDFYNKKANNSRKVAEQYNKYNYYNNFISLAQKALGI